MPQDMDLPGNPTRLKCRRINAPWAELRPMRNRRLKGSSTRNLLYFLPFNGLSQDAEDLHTLCAWSPTECPSVFSCDTVASTKTHYLAFAFPPSLSHFLCSSLLLPWNHSSKYSFSFKLVFLDLSWETSLLFHDNCVSSTVLGALNILSQQLNDINILNIVISILQVRNWDTEILRIFHKVL